MCDQSRRRFSQKGPESVPIGVSALAACTPATSAEVRQQLWSFHPYIWPVRIITILTYHSTFVSIYNTIYGLHWAHFRIDWTVFSVCCAAVCRFWLQCSHFITNRSSEENVWYVTGTVTNWEWIFFPSISVLNLQYTYKCVIQTAYTVVVNLQIHPYTWHWVFCLDTLIYILVLRFYMCFSCILSILGQDYTVFLLIFGLKFI